MPAIAENRQTTHNLEFEQLPFSAAILKYFFVVVFSILFTLLVGRRKLLNSQKTAFCLIWKNILISVFNTFAQYYHTYLILSCTTNDFIVFSIIENLCPEAQDKFLSLSPWCAK